MFENTGPLIFTIIAILICAFFYFEIRGLKTPPTIWLFGNMHQMIQAEHHTAQYEWMQKYSKLFSLYLGMTPTVVIADPQLVKQVIIREFHHFVNQIQLNATHELWDKNLFSANDEAWKRIRSITSPSFTSGKLRAMGQTMQTCIDKLSAYFERLIKSGSGVMDTKKVIAGFTIDVIAGFATETDTNAGDFSVHPLEGANYDEDYFDTVMSGIPYLEAVIKETLRRYPPLCLLTRVCDEDGYQLTSELKIFKNQIVQISLSGIHLNPEYYPESTRFNPERFMPQNKHFLVPYSFLPFCLRPRKCVTMRFAYQEIKLCLAHVVRKFKFSTVPETPEKLIFKKAGSLLRSFPFSIKFSSRNQTK